MIIKRLPGRDQRQILYDRKQPGDPDKTGYVLIDVIESTDTPLRFVMGSDGLKAVRGALEKRLQEMDVWEKFSAKTDYIAEDI